MTLYLYEEREVPMSMVGVVILISGIASAVSQLFAGSITDRVGRRPMLLITFSASLVMFLGMSLLIGYRAPVLSIVVLYTLVRSALMMQRPAIQAIVVDLAPREKLTESYGLLRIGGNLGFAAGPAIGGFLAGILDYAWIFGLAALISGAAMAVIYFFFRETRSTSSQKVDISSVLLAAKDRNLLTFVLLSLLVFLVMGQLGTTLSVFTVSLAGFSTAQFGFLLTLNGLTIVVLQFPFTWLLKRFALYKSLVLGAMFYGAGYLLMSWVGGYGLAILGVITLTMGEIVFMPASSAIVGQMAAPEWRGRYMAFSGLSETIGFSFGPLIGGLLLDEFSSTPLLIWGPISGMAFIAAAGLFRWGAVHGRNTEKEL